MASSTTAFPSQQVFASKLLGEQAYLEVISYDYRNRLHEIRALFKVLNSSAVFEKLFNQLRDEASQTTKTQRHNLKSRDDVLERVLILVRVAIPLLITMTYDEASSHEFNCLIYDILVSFQYALVCVRDVRLIKVFRARMRGWMEEALDKRNSDNLAMLLAVCVRFGLYRYTIPRLSGSNGTELLLVCFQNEIASGEFVETCTDEVNFYVRKALELVQTRHLIEAHNNMLLFSTLEVIVHNLTLWRGQDTLQRMGSMDAPLPLHLQHKIHDSLRACYAWLKRRDRFASYHLEDEFSRVRVLRVPEYFADAIDMDPLEEMMNRIYAMTFQKGSPTSFMVEFHRSLTITFRLNWERLQGVTFKNPKKKAPTDFNGYLRALIYYVVTALDPPFRDPALGVQLSFDVLKLAEFLQGADPNRILKDDSPIVDLDLLLFVLRRLARSLVSGGMVLWYPLVVYLLSRDDDYLSEVDGYRQYGELVEWLVDTASTGVMTFVSLMERAEVPSYEISPSRDLLSFLMGTLSFPEVVSDELFREYGSHFRSLLASVFDLSGKVKAETRKWRHKTYGPRMLVFLTRLIEWTNNSGTTLKALKTYEGPGVQAKLCFMLMADWRLAGNDDGGDGAQLLSSSNESVSDEDITNIFEAIATFSSREALDLESLFSQLANIDLSPSAIALFLIRNRKPTLDSKFSRAPYSLDLQLAHYFTFIANAVDDQQGPSPTSANSPNDIVKREIDRSLAVIDEFLRFGTEDLAWFPNAFSQLAMTLARLSVRAKAQTARRVARCLEHWTKSGGVEGYILTPEEEFGSTLDNFCVAISNVCSKGLDGLEFPDGADLFIQQAVAFVVEVVDQPMDVEHAETALFNLTRHSHRNRVLAVVENPGFDALLAAIILRRIFFSAYDAAFPAAVEGAVAKVSRVIRMLRKDGSQEIEAAWIKTKKEHMKDFSEKDWASFEPKMGHT